MKDKDEVLKKQVAFGKYLKEKRERLGYIQEDVADHIGVSRPAYIRYENGQRGLDLDSIMILSVLLKFSFDDFTARYERGDFDV